MAKGEKISEQLNLKQQALDYEKMLSEQKERIFYLVDENNKLKELNDIYKKNEEKVNAALILAVEKAGEYEQASKLSYELEIKKMKTYYAKWLNYLNKVKKLLPEDKNLLAAEKLIKDLDVLVFNADENLKKEQFLVKDPVDKEIESQYQAEKERIEKINKDEIYNKYLEGFSENAAAIDGAEQAEIKKLTPKEFAKIIEKIAKLSEGGNGKGHLIDLQEIQNPKDLPDLDTLCSELGIG